MALLVTVARAKQTQALSRVSTTFLTNLLTAASGKVESYLNTPVDTAARTEDYNGTGLTQMSLRAIPVTALGNIIITDSVGGTTTIAGSNFSFDPQVARIAFSPSSTSDRTVFTAGFQNISVTYTAGYASDAIPEAIQEGVIQVALRLYVASAPANPEFGNEKLGEYQRQLVSGSEILITPLIEEILSEHRLLRI